MSQIQSFDDFYREEFPLVYKVMFLATGNRADAEDATNEAFARALVRWSRLHDQKWAGGWVMKTALNLIRRGRRRGRPLLPQGEKEPNLEEVLDLRNAIRRLSLRRREAVFLHYVADLSVSDVAELMHCSPGTVKALLSQARGQIAQQVRETRSE